MCVCVCVRVCVCVYLCACKMRYWHNFPSAILLYTSCSLHVPGTKSKSQSTIVSFPDPHVRAGGGSENETSLLLNHYIKFMSYRDVLTQ